MLVRYSILRLTGLQGSVLNVSVLNVSVQVGWHLFDQTLQAAASPEGSESLLVTEPFTWAANRANTVITMSDQIPVWLKPTPGKTLTSVLRLQVAAEQRKIRRQNKALSKGKAKAKAKTGPRIASVRRAPGLAARWRVSFVARQAVRRYFQPGQAPEGVVQPSILVVYGGHCRLENISPDGRWLQSEEFWVGSKHVVRQQGEAVPGQVMKSWRKLRRSQPQLFADGQIRIWSQPSAVVDSVIYRWQLELDRQEAPQAINLVDHFAAAWTDDSLHAAALLQRHQTGVPASCTGLCQVIRVEGFKGLRV